jgi:predicted kinase
MTRPGVSRLVMPTSELVVLIGLQASGKTTFYREHFSQSHVHVSKDSFRNARNREKRQNALLDEAFREGNSVVLDNTNPSREVRAAAIAIAQRHGALVRGLYFESRPELSIARNANRDRGSRVPEVGLRAVASQLERPSFDEGFARLEYVRIVDGRFIVEPWVET